MRGTALLYAEDQGLTVLEHVEYDAVEQMQEKIGCSHCTGKILNEEVDFGNVEEILWAGDDIDWSYGY